jgi:hypothetical protein
MALVQIRLQGHKYEVDLSRVPVAGDYVAKGNDAIRVAEVVLLQSNAPVSAVVFTETAQPNVSTKLTHAASEFELA